ncbi:hypothetical protein [Mycobacterium leprae]|nr:hypothetical protein [Mycobacterium leprae]
MGKWRAYTATAHVSDSSWGKRDADGEVRASIEDAHAIGLAGG